MREYAIDDECVEGDYDDGDYYHENEEQWHRDALFLGKRILDGVVLEGEVLVERFDGVEGVEGDEEDSGRKNQYKSPL